MGGPRLDGHLLPAARLTATALRQPPQPPLRSGAVVPAQLQVVIKGVGPQAVRGDLYAFKEQGVDEPWHQRKLRKCRAGGCATFGGRGASSAAGLPATKAGLSAV